MSTTTTRPPLAERIAGAPISWGVCEVPGWGFQLDVDTVLREMREVGIVATEFGPDGFLPDEPVAKADALAAAGLSAVGQFVPVVLHDAGHDPLPEVESAMEALTVAGATTVVVAAATGVEGYDARPELDDEQWDTMLANLDLVTAAAEARGLTATVHPHVGTMVESGAEAERVLAGSRIGLCLDTGHLLIGGGDPVAIARSHPDRIGHVHLKDVRLDLASRVQSGELSYTDGVSAGMYVPLGEGDVDIAAIVGSLEDAGYAGWYVLEQDTILTGSPSQTGVDPLADVRASIAHITALAERLGGRSDG
ncbi:sugar phosphate isomerase/epimerase [Knoellia locipacati]|uniref:Inosose dehydratase n=1 Tax=Knoellia locipacati TaxID=882824 RepID=A0A512SYX4_9MICO|nr:TIM barrel protein [Knoellia locipacati]GEQ13144.1 inosose dehydratase [Knoellia locipacati]